MTIFFHEKILHQVGATTPDAINPQFLDTS